jgi:nicotinamide-nucleotide amidase
MVCSFRGSISEPGQATKQSDREDVFMPQNLTAEIIAIGTEILLGEITDTNSVHIARVFRDIGLNLHYMTSVGDNEGRISNVIRTALSRADVVITCGGLGPTVDDMTRQAVAAATGRGLTFHQDLLNKIAERFASFRAQMTDNNRQQAYLPDNAILIENPVGTAPSFIVEHEGRVVISLPGVPREMKYLIAEKVVPYLRERFNLRTDIIKARVLRTAGIGESMLDAQIGKELLEMSNPTVGLAAHSGQVDVRITAKADSEAEADSMIAQVEQQLHERIGEYVFGFDDDKIEEVVVRLLLKYGAKLAISETGVGDAITRSVKSARQGEQVLATVQTFPNPDELRSTLSLGEDAPIRDLAERAAESACTQSGALVGIAVVCRPDMGEQHADNEAGTALATYMPGKMRSRVYGFGGQSETALAWATTWSLSMAWRLLKEHFDA